ncbi:hypothetical protein [Kiloniella sp.]|uniref:hypothetical protein n=1 Tax=Kiloniella sp. TaxID=1938587 RepID=UPI003B02BBA5
MSIHNVGQRFKSRLRTIDGRSFYGLIGKLPNNRSDINFVTPRRVLEVSPNTKITVRTTFKAPDRKVYLTADNGSISQQLEIYKTFRLFEMQQLLPWSTKIKTKNPVTGLEETTSNSPSTPIYTTLEPLSDERDSLKIPGRRFRLITGADLKVDDKVGAYTVTKIDTLLGVTIAEVK